MCNNETLQNVLCTKTIIGGHFEFIIFWWEKYFVIFWHLFTYLTYKTCKYIQVIVCIYLAPIVLKHSVHFLQRKMSIISSVVFEKL